MSGLKLLISDSHGVYIPQHFVESFDKEQWHINQDDVDDCADPSNQIYWDAWDDILNKAYYIDEKENKWVLYQDGDLWAICYNLLTEEEKKNFGFID